MRAGDKNNRFVNVREAAVEAAPRELERKIKKVASWD
jgi:hypothetical protein